MKTQNIDLLDGFWDRVEDEISKHEISKLKIAERCRFERKTLYRSPQHHYMYLPYFARLCAELNVSADCILFGKKK